MTIEFKPGRYIHGIWFVGNGRMDMMGCLWKDKDDAFTFDYRMRYYASPDPHDADDRKSWYKVTFKADITEDKAAQLIGELMESAAVLMPKGTVKPKVEFCPFKCDGGDPSVPHLFRAMPWLHSRKPTPEEEAQWKKDGVGS